MRTLNYFIFFPFSKNKTFLVHVSTSHMLSDHFSHVKFIYLLVTLKFFIEIFSKHLSPTDDLLITASVRNAPPEICFQLVWGVAEVQVFLKSLFPKLSVHLEINQASLLLLTLSTQNNVMTDYGRAEGTPQKSLSVLPNKMLS
jgi:hypothetical protein